MTITDDVVTFVHTVVPPTTAVHQARDRLDDICRLLRHSGAAAEAAHPGGAPTAMNRAWRIALAAARRAPSRDWPSVAATVIALEPDSRHHLDTAAVAVAVGSAVARQVVAALESSPGADRWSRSGVAGVIGAGAAAGRLLGLDETPLRNLFGLCATQAAGLRAVEESETGALQVAKAAADAVEAAVLARHGFTSSADGLGGRRGLLALMAPKATWPDNVGWPQW
jgi:2-methylcitrate dehydratase PrpD